MDDAGDGASVDGYAAEAGQGGVSIQAAGIEIFRDVSDPARAREESCLGFTPAPILASHVVA